MPFLISFSCARLAGFCGHRNLPNEVEIAYGVIYVGSSAHYSAACLAGTEERAGAAMFAIIAARMVTCVT